MGKTKKSNTKTKESRWTGSVFILGDKQERPTKHTFIIKTSGNKKTLTVLNQYNEVWNKKEGWGKELAEQYPVFIEDKPFKGFKAFTPNSVLNNVMNLEKISIFITMRGSHQGGPRHSYKEQLVCSMMTSKGVASLKHFLSKHSKSNKKTKKGGVGSSSSDDELKRAAMENIDVESNKTRKRARTQSSGTPWPERSPSIPGVDGPSNVRDMAAMHINPYTNPLTKKVLQRKPSTGLIINKAIMQPKPKKHKPINKSGNVSPNKDISRKNLISNNSAFHTYNS